jgi:hypothetical protein
MAHRGGPAARRSEFDQMSTPLVRPSCDKRASDGRCYARCCGLDIHKKLIVACTIVPGRGRRPHKQVRMFETMTDDRNASDWLTEQGSTHVAMESTGSYWRPIFNVLEDRFALVLVNAPHLQAVWGLTIIGTENRCRRATADLLDSAKSVRRSPRTNSAAESSVRSSLQLDAANLDGALFERNG